jgi:hypothetical protein
MSQLTQLGAKKLKKREFSIFWSEEEKDEVGMKGKKLALVRES